MTATAPRLAALEQQIRKQAREALEADIRTRFETVIALAPDDSARDTLQTLLEETVKARTEQAEDEALEAFLRRSTPTMDVARFFNPRMVKLGSDGNETSAHHCAVLLPDFGVTFDSRKPPRADNWQHAKELASQISLFGADDWQLAPLRYAQLIIDRTRCAPALNTDLFPNHPTDDWYWTATEHATASESAWVVLLHHGGVYSNVRYDSGYVLGCRLAPASQ